jgi:hypothetical protein
MSDKLSWIFDMSAIFMIGGCYQLLIVRHHTRFHIHFYKDNNNAPF